MRGKSLIWLWCVLAAGNLPSWADGCYVPESATLKMPEITAQRAVLRWKDGAEALLISSALNAEAQKLGWIIPVPASPSKIEKADPGGLKTLAMLTQPKIIHDLSQVRRLAIAGLVVLVVITATAVFRPDRLLDLLQVLGLLVVLGLLFPFPFLASLGRPSVTAGRRAIVEKTARVGSYDVSILHPATFEELATWLADQGYVRLPATGSPTVTDYIKRGWAFAAIRLVRDDIGDNAPHPIRIEFAARDPVYPLRLTALAGSNVSLELYVVADSRANIAGLPVRFCDRFESDRRGYRGATTGVRIGHPEITALMWPGCVVTKATAKLTPASMRDDLKIGPANFAPCRERRFSPQGARSVSTMAFAVCFGMFLTGSMIGWRERLKEGGATVRYLRARCLPALVVSAGIGALAYAVIPKVPSERLIVGPPSRKHVVVTLNLLEQVVTNNPGLLDLDPTQMGVAVLNKINERYPPEQRPIINPYTGAEMTIESTPGNLTLEKAGDKMRARLYDFDGYPEVVELP
jgi:hypothetical protein